MDKSLEQLYKALIQSTDDFIYICECRTGTFRYPKALVEMFPLPGEVIKDPLPYWKEIVHPDDWERFYKSNMEIVNDISDSHLVEFRGKTREGEYVWLRCRGHLMRDSKGEQDIFSGIMCLMGKQNKVDPLTQLLNRGEFHKALKEQVASEAVEHLAVILLDLDEFRQVNELYDRNFGNEVLKTMGQAVQSVLPDNAALYRIEKDQMGILLKNASAKEAEALYDEIRHYLLRIPEWKRRNLMLDISAGCSMYPENSSQVEELVSYAEYALQRAKREGKGRIAFFTEDVHQQRIQALEILRQLKEEKDRGYDGFYLNYQPQVNTITGEVIGAEVLMRWKNSEGQFVSPAEFIPILEEHGMIYDIGLWMIRTALRQSKEWIQRCPDFHISVNVSALQFLEERFLEDLYRIMEEENFPGSSLVVELTESYAFKNIGILQEKFNDLRSHGIQMALDDFGTGYCSLAALKHTPVDIVKIDRTFVKNILENDFDSTFISLVVEICHTVQIKVCLEGVETEEEYTFLRQIPIDYIQGYYFGRPVPPEEISIRLS